MALSRCRRQRQGLRFQHQPASSARCGRARARLESIFGGLGAEGDRNDLGGLLAGGCELPLHVGLSTKGGSHVGTQRPFGIRVVRSSVPVEAWWFTPPCERWRRRTDGRSRQEERKGGSIPPLHITLWPSRKLPVQPMIRFLRTKKTIDLFRFAADVASVFGHSRRLGRRLRVHHCCYKVLSKAECYSVDGG